MRNFCNSDFTEVLRFHWSELKKVSAEWKKKKMAEMLEIKFPSVLAAINMLFVFEIKSLIHMNR